MSEFDYDSDQRSADAPEGEFGFDCDSDDGVYYFGDGLGAYYSFRKSK